MVAPVVAVLVGAVVLPYLALWVSRVGRVRGVAVAVNGTGWHAVVGLVGVVLTVLTLGVGLPPAALVVAGVLVGGYAHVEAFVAADEIRRYPDDRALHYDLGRPGTWPATSLRTYATWTWLQRARHPWTAGAFTASAALVLAGVVYAPLPALALGAYGAAMALACNPLPAPGQRRAAERLSGRVGGRGDAGNRRTTP